MSQVELSHPYERRPISSLRDALKLGKETVQRGEHILYATDFDSTISMDGRSGGESPFDTNVNPLCYDGLNMISEHGAIPVVISNRLGKKLEKLLPDIKNLLIRGSYGFETRIDGQSIVDSRFYSLAPEISHILSSLEQQMSPEIAHQIQEQNDVETLLQTSMGPIYLERKALGAIVHAPYDQGTSHFLSSGLAHSWNLNSIPPIQRASLVNRAEAIVRDAESNIPADKLDSLNAIWGFTKSNPNPHSSKRYSFGLEPTIRQGKALSLRATYDSLVEKGINIGMIVMSGDADADAEGMEEAYMIEKETQGKVKALGLHIAEDPSQQKVARVRDISINDVSTHGMFLMDMGFELQSLYR